MQENIKKFIILNEMLKQRTVVALVISLYSPLSYIYPAELPIPSLISYFPHQRLQVSWAFIDFHILWHIYLKPSAVFFFTFV